jgi:hypothetical protein
MLTTDSLGASENQYFTRILVGSEGQRMPVLVDTGFQDLVILDESCKTSACTKRKGGLFRSSVSTTHHSSKTKTSSSFSQDHFEGFWVKDRIQLDHYIWNDLAFSTYKNRTHLFGAQLLTRNSKQLLAQRPWAAHPHDGYHGFWATQGPCQIHAAVLVPSTQDKTVRHVFEGADQQHCWGCSSNRGFTDSWVRAGDRLW